MSQGIIGNTIAMRLATTADGTQSRKH